MLTTSAYVLVAEIDSKVENIGRASTHMFVPRIGEWDERLTYDILHIIWTRIGYNFRVGQILSLSSIFHVLLH